MSKRTYTAAEKKRYAAKMAKARAAAAAPPPRRAPVARKKAAPRRSTYTDGAAGGALGGLAGAAIGGAPGAAIGTLLGKGAHKMLKALTGFGDYRVLDNSLMRGGMSPPEIVNSATTGGVIIRHREYLCDINASANWNLLAFPLNPGIATTFPFLSQIAPAFEQYRLRGGVFEFKSLSSDAVLSTATSSALGSVIMATDYNVLNNNFATKTEMENYEFANSSKPSCSFLHPIECARDQTPVSDLYIRTSSTSVAAGDQRLYDLGKFQIVTVGMQAAQGVAGELWFTYEVELRKPKISYARDQFIHYELAGTLSGANPIGSPTVTRTMQPGNTLTGMIYVSSTRTFQFPLGIPVGTQFLVEYDNMSLVAASIVPPVITLTGATLVPYWNVGLINMLTMPSTGSSVAFHQAFIMKVTVAAVAVGDVSMSWGNAGTVPGGDVASDLTITQIPPAVLGGV